MADVLGHRDGTAHCILHSGLYSEFVTLDCYVQRSFEMLQEAYSSVYNCTGIVRLSERQRDKPWRDSQPSFCARWEETIRGTKFAAISAEFTIFTANLLAVLLSCERLCAVVFPIFCRRKASLGRSLILVVGVLFYGLTLSLSILAESLWRRTTARHCMIEVRITFVTLIVVDIALVYAVRLENAKTHCLDGQFNS